MGIQSGDVKLLKTAVMADVPEGGGAATGVQVPDGQSNSIFADISELDRAGGDVSMRKVVVAVHTDDQDTYLGANVIVAEPTKDPRVSVTLFATDEPFDTRGEAIQRVESYLNQGPEWPGYLYEGHIKGQRVIQLFQRPAAEVPPVGRTLVLIQDEGLGAQVTQYVRATKVSSVIREFFDAGSGTDYKAAIVTVELSDALRTDFRGSPASRTFQRTTNGTKVRDTVVADAGSYVGVSPLRAAANMGAYTVRAESIFTQLVPSARTETPISLSNPHAASGMPVPGAAPVTFINGYSFSPTANLRLPGGILPGSLNISSGANVYTDDGTGLLLLNGAEIGTVDYANGILTRATGSDSNFKNVTYTPATVVFRAPQSAEFRITQETRTQSYVGVLTPIPARGTLSVSFVAQGRWYVLSDTGNGQLRGLDASYGAGTINFSTGAYVITFGALPDADTSLIFSWNVPTQETALPGATLKAKQRIYLQPSDPNASLQPGSLSMSWPIPGGATGTTTAGANGILGGLHATGEVNVAQGWVDFAPNTLPAQGAQITLNYTTGPKQVDTFAHPSRDGNGMVPVIASAGALTPGSVEVEWNTLTDLAAMQTYTRAQLAKMNISVLVDPIQQARDDGNGNMVRNGQIIGSVDYATGTVVFNPDVQIKIPQPNYALAGEVPSAAGATPGPALAFDNGSGRFRIRYSGMSYVDVPSMYPNDESGVVKLRYNSPGSTNNETQVVTFEPSLELVPEVRANLLPGSVLVGVSGAFWGDDGLGNLFSIESDGSRMARGTIDYTSGLATITAWPSMSNSFSRASAVVTVGEVIMSEYVFRTAAAPIAPGSLAVTFPTASGTSTVTADVNGLISGTGVQGYVDYETGIVRVRFGTWVTAAGNEGEPWYDSRYVLAGQIFRPEPVAASAVRYSAVAYSYLPLNADILGIDPVRLPSDGRVPIFREGGFAVVGHTGTIEATVSNGQTINCGRVRLSRVRVLGADGNAINTGYTFDLEAGTVTFSDVSGYSQPVTIEHRIEDMGVVREAQISGEISFTRPLSHSYPLGSYVSSALVAGDLFSRVSRVFDQQSWVNNEWSDNQVGDPATGTYNTAQYPIEVTNRGAITERWVLRFTSTTTFDIIGEHVGVIGSGNINTDCAPKNPATDVPYFTIRSGGWGLGWAVGNVVRLNTIGAQFPFWTVRTVQQGAETVLDDNFTLLARGGVNRD